MANLLSECTNYLGPISKDTEDRLRAVLATPNQMTWNNAYSILIAPGCSLWNAVIKVDPKFPKSREDKEIWPQVPDQLTIARAIKFATQGSRNGC